MNIEFNRRKDIIRFYNVRDKDILTIENILNLQNTKFENDSNREKLLEHLDNINKRLLKTDSRYNEYLNFLKSIKRNNKNEKSIHNILKSVDLDEVPEKKFGYPIISRIGGDMFRIPKLKCEDLFPDGELGYGTFPAFIGKDGKEFPYIDIARFPASIENGKLQSKDFGLNTDSYLTNINFDEAREKCIEMGKGFHLMTIWEWALVAFLYEKIFHDQYENKNYSHNGLKSGIRYLFDRYENKCNWTWLDGFKQDEDNNFRLNVVNDITLNYNVYNENKWKILFHRPKCFTDYKLFSNYSEECKKEINSKEILTLKRALIVQPDNTKFLGQIWYNAGERMLGRGGSWNFGATAGLGAFILNNARSDSNASDGFRFSFLPV